MFARHRYRLIKPWILQTDGSRILSAADDKTIKVWHEQNRSALVTIDFPLFKVWDLPTGRRLVTLRSIVDYFHYQWHLGKKQQFVIKYFATFWTQSGVTKNPALHWSFQREKMSVCVFLVFWWWSSVGPSWSPWEACNVGKEKCVSRLWGAVAGCSNADLWVKIAGGQLLGDLL